MIGRDITMIDWVTAIVPVSNLDLSNLHNGHFCRIRPDGNTEWMKEIPMDIPGSFDSNIRVSACFLDSGPHLRVDGNPIKWIQGHNLFGSNDLIGLMKEVLHRLAYILEFIPNGEVWKSWNEGLYQVNRVDCTEMWDFPSKDDVLAWLNAAQYQSKSRHGRSIMTGGTLYFGKHSRRWSIKFYSKGEEILVRSHTLNSDLPHYENLIEYAKNKLRCELVLRKPQLEKLDLEVAAAWTTETAKKTLKKSLKTLDISDQYKITIQSLEGLPSRLKLAYKAWEDNNDLRSILPKNTFYRYRRELLKFGIDISVSKQNRNGSFVPLKKVLEEDFIDIPDWADGSEILFTPPFISDAFPKQKTP